MILHLVLLLACKKASPPDGLPDVDFTRTDSPETTGRALVPVGAGQWEGGGVTLYVPPGWTGVSGAPEPVLLSIRQQSTGVKLELLELPGQDGPRELPDQSCTFVDRGSYRSAPALGRAGVATCVGPEGTRQVWFGRVEGRWLHVEATYPAGQATRGRQSITPILRSLQRTL